MNYKASRSRNLPPHTIILKFGMEPIRREVSKLLVIGHEMDGSEQIYEDAFIMSSNGIKHQKETKRDTKYC